MATAEEIAKANAWYTQNVGPVTGETTNFREVAAQRVSDPYYGQTAEQRQDAINEQQKHMIAFHPEQYYGVSVSSLGNVPLSQIADRYGTAMADKVQQHYADNPTSEAMAYKQEYTMRHGGPDTVSAYNDNSAAGIAAMVAATGGVQNPYLAQKAVSEGYYIEPSSISTSSGRSVVVTPIADILPGAIGSSIGDVATVFTPYGEYAQTAVENAKIVVGETTGEIGIYQLLYDPNTGNVRNIMNLVGGGGRAAAQSGMFSYDVPLTPVVYTQESGGTKFDVSANVSEAVKVITSPESYSRLGAEAYGGFVQMLDSRTLTPESKVSTYESPYNIANFVEPLGVNVPKSQAPGINLPWGISVASPLVQYADERGLTGESVGNVVRSLQTQEPVAAITSAPSLIVTGMTKGGALFGAQAADVVGVYKYGTTEQYTVEKTATPAYEQTGLTQYQQSVLGGYSGGLIGYLLFGEKSPEVIKGGIAASISDATFGLLNLPVKGSGEKTPYGEFSLWSTGAGETYQRSTGITSEKITTLSKATEAMPINPITAGFVASVGLQETLAKNPGTIVSGIGAGAIWAMGGEVVGGVAKASPILTRVAESTAAKVAPYAAYGGITAWSVTEGFTASAGKTLGNVGRVTPSLAGMAVGSVGAQMLFRSTRGGFSTQEMQKPEEIKVIDLREVIDLRDVVDLTTVSRPENVATRAEQAMIIQQYGLTPAEISMAKRTGATLNDILSIREVAGVSEVKTVEPIQVIDLREVYDLRQLTDVQTRTIVTPEVVTLPEVITLPMEATRVRTIQIPAALAAQQSIQRVDTFAVTAQIPAVASVSGTATDEITRVDTMAILAQERALTGIQRVDAFAAPSLGDIERIDTVGIIRVPPATPFTGIPEIPYYDKITTTPPQPPVVIREIIQIPPVVIPPIALPSIPSGGGGGSGGWKQGLKRAQLETSYIGPRLFRAPKVKMPKKRRK